MAWELMNEIRCPSDHSGNTVQVIITKKKKLFKKRNSLLDALEFVIVY